MTSKNALDKNYNEIFRNIVDSVEDYAIFMLDSEGRVITWNAGAQKIKGYAPEEIIGQHFSRFYLLSDRENNRPYQLLQEAVLKGRVSEEGWRVRKDGSLFWANVVLTAIKDASGKVTGFVKVSREVRSRIEEIWRRVFCSAPNALVMIDANKKVALVNPQTEKLFQYSEKELIGKNIDDLIPGLVSKKLLNENANPEKLRQGYVVNEGLPLLAESKDKKKISVRVRLNDIPMPEGPYVLVVVEDMTERLEIEKRLASINEELEQKVNERTALAEQRAIKLRELATALTLTEQKERRRLAQILHDHLQQMLVAAKIGIRRLYDKINEPPIRANIAQIDNLIEESIEASRKLTIELSPPVLRDGGLVPALEWLGRWMKEKHGLEVEVQTDPGMIKNPSEDRKIFLFDAVKELLFNVVKHAGTNRASVRIFPAEDAICVSVEDQGKGFHKKQMNADPSGHFGLFNIQERLDMLGCRMTIESEIGKGSKFSIFAPSEDPAPVEEFVPTGAKQWNASHVHGSVIRILVADDHKILRQGLIHALRAFSDIQIIAEAENGIEAVEKAMSLQPDIVVMDITMPKMNGVEATRRIKQASPKIKIVGLSLHEAEDMESTMMRAGASIYLNKSGPIDSLITSIRNLAAQQPLLK